MKKKKRKEKKKEKMSMTDEDYDVVDDVFKIILVFRLACCMAKIFFLSSEILNVTIYLNIVFITSRLAVGFR